ncbi:PD-(D/E)XK motif protein [Amycolatopsis silviterrae]|uniref:PD-(D/E)XK motif protein n=1 Tax=Amycolatopsis silviterrae TaxID=1656914 RepID=A0ABW5HP31_9PSEU
MKTTVDRHLDVAGFERCLAAGVPVEFPVEGRPRAAVFIDPATPAIGIRVPDDGSRPAAGLEHLLVRTIHRDDARWTEVLITRAELFLDGYPLLCSILDRIQLQRLSTAVAVTDTLRILGSLLRRVDSLSLETELGLIGELVVLRSLNSSVGVGDAVEAWCGPAAEEHDFALPGLDLEVKTTQGERRAHWISSLHQLDTSPGRPLWMLSVQVTRTGPGAGTTLVDRIDAVRAEIGEGTLRETFNAKLRQVGWHDALAPTMRTRWRLRSVPGAYLVDDAFPRLTPSTLTGIDMARVPDVRYRIDLSGLESATSIPDILHPAVNPEL